MYKWYQMNLIFKFEKVDGKYEPNALDIINNIKGTSYTYSNETTKEDWDKDVDFPSNELWEEMIGPKWLYVEYEHDELPKSCNIVLRTAWSVPTAFLNVLINELQKIDPECYFYGDYEDESYEDNFYTENYHDGLHQLTKDLEVVYLEYLQDRIDNPEEYKNR